MDPNVEGKTCGQTAVFMDSPNVLGRTPMSIMFIDTLKCQWTEPNICGWAPISLPAYSQSMRSHDPYIMAVDSGECMQKLKDVLMRGIYSPPLCFQTAAQF